MIRFSRVLMTASVLCIIIFGLLFLHSNKEYAEGDAAYQEIQSAVRERTQAKQENADISGQQAASLQEQTAKSEEIPLPAYPDLSVSMDFSGLKAINPDAAGWIWAYDDVINYPVVLGNDNDYYLTHLFNGKSNRLGSVFMDYRSKGDFSDRNTAVYGHNMKDGSMFSSLNKYKKQEYYEKFPEMLLYTPEGNYKLEFFAGILASGSDEFIRLDFSDDEDFLSYTEEMKKKSTFKSDVSLEPGDRIVTLCTCSYDFHNARYALFGKLAEVADFR